MKIDDPSRMLKGLGPGHCLKNGLKAIGPTALGGRERIAAQGPEAHPRHLDPFTFSHHHWCIVDYQKASVVLHHKALGGKIERGGRISSAWRERQVSGLVQFDSGNTRMFSWSSIQIFQLSVRWPVESQAWVRLLNENMRSRARLSSSSRRSRYQIHPHLVTAGGVQCA